MGIKIKVSGKVTRRFKEVRKDGQETFCIAVSDCAEKFPNILKLKAQSKEQLDCAAVGNDVEADVWVDGREWTSPEKKVLYFTDFRIAAIHERKKNDVGEGNESVVIGDGEAPDDLPF